MKKSIIGVWVVEKIFELCVCVKQKMTSQENGSELIKKFDLIRMVERFDWPKEKLTICESDVEKEEEEEDTDYDGEEHDERALVNKFAALGKEGKHDSDDDSDEDEEVDQELIEDTLFALQPDFFFITRLHVHSSSGIYHAIDRNSLDEVVVKVYTRGRRALAPVECRALKLIERINETDHPAKKYVQHMRALYESDFSTAMVSDIVPDDSYNSLYKDRDEIRVYMRQLLETIAMLHKHGMVHRDIKHSNVLWGEKKRQICLIDFDLVTFTSGDTKHTAVLGTDVFMAPEVMAHDHDNSTAVPYDERIDVYSAGVLMGCLLTGLHETDVTTNHVQQWTRRVEGKKKKRGGKKKKKSEPVDMAHCLVRRLLRPRASRPSAAEVLEHPFFAEKPKPKPQIL